MQNPSLFSFFLICFLVINPMTAMAQEDDRPVIRINGSSTVTGAVMIPYEEEIQKAAGVTLNRLTTSSGRGFQALLDDRADLAMVSSRPATLIERMAAKGRVVDEGSIETYFLGSVDIQFIVPEASPVKGLTIEQIRSILTGEVTGWADLGYPELGDIRLITENPTGGMFATAEKEILVGEAINQDFATSLQNGPQVAVVVSQLPNGIGLFSSAIQPELRQGTRVLPVEGLDVSQYMALIKLINDECEHTRRVVKATLDKTAHMREAASE